MMEETRVAKGRQIPWWVWASALLVAFLRSLPFIKTLLSNQPDFVQLPIGFIPKDWLAYAAMIRHIGEDGIFLNNPFTTEPQGARFILLFHQLLGMIHASTGIDPLWLLELSRWPLTALFAVVLWKFAGKVFQNRSHQKWAFFLVMFSGGIEYPFIVLFQHLAAAGIGHPGVLNSAIQDMWHLYGWNTFQAAFNPLWLCGLVGIVGFAGLIIQIQTISVRKAAMAAVGFVLLWFVHSYSAMAVAGIAAGTFFTAWIRQGTIPDGLVKKMMLVFIPALILIAAVSLWQIKDGVFAASAGGLFGTQAPSVFWLPLTLGVAGILALRGWLTCQYDACTNLIAGWTIAALLMASSTLINGYHFVFMIHIPICLAAAPVASRLFSGGRLRAVLVAVLLFGSTVPSTMQAISDVGGLSTVPVDAMNLVKDLANKEPGNVLAPPELGNIIPALSPHKVWVGQWFMSPDYQKRSASYWKWMKGPANDTESAAEMVQTLASQHIRWLVIPSASLEKVRNALAGIPFSTKSYGVVSLLGIGTEKPE